MAKHIVIIGGGVLGSRILFESVKFSNSKFLRLVDFHPKFHLALEPKVWKLPKCRSHQLLDNTPFSLHILLAPFYLSILLPGYLSRPISTFPYLFSTV